MGRNKIPKPPAYDCVYVYDTETGTDKDYTVDGRVGAYLLNMQRLDVPAGTYNSSYKTSDLEAEYTFAGPDTLKQWRETFLERIPRRAIMYSYNEAFDARFLVCHLLDNGYTSDSWETNQEKERQKREGKVRKFETSTAVGDDGVKVTRKKSREKSPSMDENTITPILSNGRVIMIRIINSMGHELTLLDVGNIWTNLPDWNEEAKRPMAGVEALGHMFGMHKTGLDVHKYRGLDYMPDDEEITRCRVDTQIIKRAMEKAISMGLTDCTLASSAWRIFSAIRGIGTLRDSGGRHPLGAKAVENAYNTLLGVGFSLEELQAIQGTFPADGIMDDLPETWTFDDGIEVSIRDAYMGGVVMVNPKYEGKSIKTNKGKRLVHDDCNSMHPKSMMEALPYGEPWLSEKPEGDFYVVQAEVDFRLRKGAFPTLSNGGRTDMRASWLKEGHKALTLTKYDWERMQANYDYEIIGPTRCINFHVRKNESLHVYINHFISQKKKWKEAKKRAGTEEEKTEAEVMYYLSKILLNSLYGKFGQNPEKAYQWYEKDPVTGISVRSSNTAIGEYKSPRQMKYLPIACAITGLSRKRLWDHIEKVGWENYAYGDTDSEFFFCPCETDAELKAWMEDRGIEVHPTELGAWDIEHGLDNPIAEAKFIRPKVYGLVLADGEVEIKAASVPIGAKKAIKTLKELDKDMVFRGCVLRPRNVPGGRILVTLEEYRLSKV